jgi:hypothetical protein
MGRRSLVWVGCGIVVPLLPIICVYVIHLVVDGHAPGFFDVLSNGELLVIATVLGAASAGELLTRKEDLPGKVAVLIGAIVVAVFGAAIYGIIAALGPEAHKDASQGSNSWPAILGIVGFVFALVVGASTVFVGTWEDE